MVASHSTGALAFIIILVIIIVYLYARQASWFGLGESSSQPRLASSTKKGRQNDVEDSETTQLIDSINNAARKFADI